jgi:hypothetical protein
MSGHLSTEEKALFKAEIDARRKDYAFHRVFRGKQNKVQKNRGTIVLDGMVYEDLQVSFGSPKTYQYNLETLKVSSNTVLSIKAKFIGANSLGYITGLNYILNVLPSSGITICRKDGSGKCVYQSLTAFLVNWDSIKK